jgi:NADPH:quinone reductase-like Zn-dependent oxidoreductase
MGDFGRDRLLPDSQSNDGPVVKDPMKAAVITCYGSPDVVKVLDVPKPLPAAGEVLVRVHAATVNRTDCGELRAQPFFSRLFYGLRRPRRSIFGLDFAGEVEAIGAGVVSFKPGDRVFGMCPSRSNGAQAEYVSVPERVVALMPANTRFDEAVVCEGAFYANAVLTRVALKPGHTILIYGASGAIGTAMVQLARASGAAVTAVVAGRHLELVKSLGADRAVDYTSEDFTGIGETFDVVVDAVGKTSYFRCRKLLKPEGIFAATDLGSWGQNVLLGMWSLITRSNRVFIAVPGRIKGFVGFLKSRMEAGQFRAVIDRKYPLADIANAYRYVETGQKVGIVVIDVVGGESFADQSLRGPARGGVAGAEDRDGAGIVGNRMAQLLGKTWSISTLGPHVSASSQLRSNPLPPPRVIVRIT